MNININAIDNIINGIKKESALFLRDDMQLDVIGLKDISNYSSKKYFSSIKLSNANHNFIIIINIDDNLFNYLFNQFFYDGVDEDEKEELVNALPDEIINNIVGLAIRNFSTKYKNLVLGLPLELNQKQILEIINTNISKSCEIVTKTDILVCTVVKLLD